VRAGDTPRPGILRIWFKDGNANEIISQKAYQLDSITFPLQYEFDDIPQNTYVYVLAFIDENNNNSFMEYQEFIGSAGQILTGTTDMTGVDIELFDVLKL
jgi:hypothetical protein